MNLGRIKRFFAAAVAFVVLLPAILTGGYAGSWAEEDSFFGQWQCECNRCAVLPAVVGSAHHPNQRAGQSGRCGCQWHGQCIRCPVDAANVGWSDHRFSRLRTIPVQTHPPFFGQYLLTGFLSPCFLE